MLLMVAQRFMQLLRREEGQGMVEYGLIIALVAIGAIIALGLLGDGLGDLFDRVLGSLGVGGGGGE